MKKSMGFVWLFVLLVGCTSLDNGYSSKQLFTSDTDKRAYQFLQLENNLQVLLISDAEADKAAAALSVSVGSAQDPAQRAGLAHFLEHMLFLGTDQFPESGEYQAYISAHGGGHNAYTSYEETNYFFDIDPTYFDDALQRFSRFFVAPLFNDQYVEREKNAVHSEYMAKIKNDYRRRQDALREVVNPLHPASQFSVGSLTTLADRPESKVRDDLLSFYQQHYSANRMTLAVIGPFDLAKLETMVRDRFSLIPDQQTQLPDQTQPFFKTEKLPLLLTVRPEQELRELEVLFELPSVRALYRQKPLVYIGDLVGHEGVGSLLAELKSRRWAESLSAGTDLDDRRNSLFRVGISLTEEGMEHWPEILKMLFNEIALIKEQGVNNWRYSEQGALAAMQFRHKEKTSPTHYVSGLASSMHYYPAEDVLRGPYRMDQFDKKLIHGLLSRMTPENAAVVLSGPQVKTDHITSLYEVPYGVKSLQEKLSDLKQNVADTGLMLPPPNPYIPQSFDLLPKGVDNNTAQQPSLIKSNSSLRVWHYQGGSESPYPVPKTHLYMSIKTPAVATAEGAALTDLYLRLVQEKLNETSYQAMLAGLGYSVSRGSDGFGFGVGGFDDKLSTFANVVAEALASGSWQSNDFERVRQELIRQLNNSKKDPPYRQVWREVSQILEPTNFSAEELAVVLASADEEGLRQFVDKLFAGGTLEMLVSGNISESKALQLAEQLYKVIPRKGPISAIAPRSVIKLNDDQQLFSKLKLDHPDNAVIRYYQGRNDRVAERARVLLMRQIIKAPFFNSLRTEQQLGYIVAAVDSSLQRVPGMGLLVQSPVADSPQLIKAIDQFLAEFEQQLSDLPMAEFEQHRAGLLANLQEKPKNLAEQSGRFWGSIDLRYWQFDSREKLIAQVKLLTLDDIQKLYKEVLLSQRFSLQVMTGDKPLPVPSLDKAERYLLPENAQQNRVD